MGCIPSSVLEATIPTTTTTTTDPVITTSIGNNNHTEIPLSQPQQQQPSSTTSSGHHIPVTTTTTTTTTPSTEDTSNLVPISTIQEPHQQRSTTTSTTTTKGNIGISKSDTDIQLQQETIMIGHKIFNALSPAVARRLYDSEGGNTTNTNNQNNNDDPEKHIGSTGTTGHEALHHLRNIFVTPISFAFHAATGTLSTHKETLPKFHKSSNEINFLQHVLQQHYLFESQPKSSVIKLIDAFEIYTINQHDVRAKKIVAINNDHDNSKEDAVEQYTVNIIQQGEEVTKDTAYFYILYYGQCQFIVDDQIVGIAQSGDAFGELALLYDGPRAATVTAILQPSVSSNTTTTTSKTATDGNEKDKSSNSTYDVPTFPDYTVSLFRVDQRTFRYILQQDDQDADDIKMNLLNHIDFLQHVSISTKESLTSVMVPFPFNKGDVIVQKGMLDCPWTIIERGTIRGTNIEHGYEDIIFTDGQCFGERSIIANDPAIGDAIAETAGVAFTVDRETFVSLLGNFDDIILRAQDQLKLKSIRTLSDVTQSSERILTYLSKKLVDQSFMAGEVICLEGQPLLHPAALYLIRNGSVSIQKSTSNEIDVVCTDGFFGDDQLLADMQKSVYMSPYTATAIEDCTCGVLKLRDCRNVINTRRMGQDDMVRNFDSLVISGSNTISMKDLQVHRMIGAGTFGQVFLVSRISSEGTKHAYALKVQSKYELCQSGQAQGVVREKNLMAMFHNPFVAKLVAAFQDPKCVYMLMNLLQGGELYNVMHTKHSNTLSEDKAKFYVACIAEALCYLHCSHSLVFRDLKPENVMIDDQGYAILIDFGFCKKIKGKTYTTCGTPLYLAPEVILNRGHSWAVDHWSLGIMIYEMLVGHTPFYEHGMSKAELFRNIVQGKVRPPSNASPEALNLLSGLLRRDPVKRLGSLAGSENDIIDHPWFKGIDRDLLFLKEIPAPYIPHIKDPFDSSNFGDWKHAEDKRTIRYPKLSDEDAVIFLNF